MSGQVSEVRGHLKHPERAACDVSQWTQCSPAVSVIADPIKSPDKSGNQTRVCHSQGRHLNHWANQADTLTTGPTRRYMGSRWMYGTHSEEAWAADGCMVHTVERHGQQMDVWYTQWRDMVSRWMYGTHSGETWAADGCMVHTVCGETWAVD